MRKQLFQCVAALSLLMGIAGSTLAGPIDYVFATGGQLGKVDLVTGVFTFIGPTGNFYQDLTRLPGGPLYGIDSNQDLDIINQNTGAVSSNLGHSGNGIQGIKFRPTDGTMFGFSRTELFTINTANGFATPVGLFGFTTAGLYDAAFDAGGKMYLESNSTLYSVNTATGLATLIGPTSGFSTSAYDDFLGGRIDAFTTDNQIVSIDPATGAGTFVVNLSGPISGFVFGAAPASASVPEPASLALLGIGLASVLGYGWRRRRLA